ncbi:hypothetical protein BC629DRAFT_1588433 [Irpex lacteus]|nr:hypothetical protein BC629DRAFT_1588433 [Irpex lacteus]
MDLLQDVKSSSPPIDSQQYQSYQSPDTPSFPSGLNGTHQDSSSMTSAHASHMSVSGPTTIFPSELHSAESMAMSIQMQSVPLGSMDMVTSSMQDHIQQNMLSEFSSQPTTVAPSATTSAFLPDPPMNGIETLESQHQISSSPSTATASTSVSLVSSPSTNSMVNSFMAGSSSLATALDGSRSRSASSASPGHLSVPSSELGFASGSSAPSTTASNETSFPFTSGYEQPYTVPQSKENSPDATDPHLLALGDMLKNIAKTANSGSDACTNGQTNSAATLVDQLTKHVLLVAKMAARMNLSDQPTGSPTSASSPHASNVPAAGASPPSSTGLNGSQDRHLNGLGFETSPNTSLDPAGVLDSSEMSRKRCASTLDGDRVVKALKLEPSDEPPLSMPPPAPVHSHSVPHLNVSPSFTFSAPTSIPPSMATIVEHPSLPPLSASSMPGTRPPSSSGLSHPSLHSHPSTHFPPRLDFGQQRALPPTDFSSLPLGPSSAPAPLAPTSFAPAPGAGWSDTRPTIPHHAHSVTGVPGTVSGLPIPLPLPLSTNVTHPPAPHPLPPLHTL